MNKIQLSAIILTYNDEANIEACLSSIQGWVEEIFIVDSYSNDNTSDIVGRYTDKVYRHNFETHSKQWTWAMTSLPLKCEWIFGLDADFRVSENLRNELMEVFENPITDIDGFYIRRKYYFLGKWIKFGGYYEKYLIKIFRKSKVIIDENELLDHHFYIKGITKKLNGYLIEDNLKDSDLSFWLQKHIRYSQLLALESFKRNRTIIPPSILGSPDQRTQFLKSVYETLPLFIRPLLYFIYIYFIKFGLLDGKEGLIFHFLQGFWFRFLIDSKIYQIRKKAMVEKRDVNDVIYEMYGTAIGEREGGGKQSQ